MFQTMHNVPAMLIKQGDRITHPGLVTDALVESVTTNFDENIHAHMTVVTITVPEESSSMWSSDNDVDAMVELLLHATRQPIAEVKRAIPHPKREFGPYQVDIVFHGNDEQGATQVEPELLGEMFGYEFEHISTNADATWVMTNLSFDDLLGALADSNLLFREGEVNGVAFEMSISTPSTLSADFVRKSIVDELIAARVNLNVA